MNQNTSLKINDPVNTFIKCLNFAERLFQEQANLDWVPGWLMTTLGINSCALGIFQEQRYVVYLPVMTMPILYTVVCRSRSRRPADRPGKSPRRIAAPYYLRYNMNRGPVILSHGAAGFIIPR